MASRNLQTAKNLSLLIDFKGLNLMAKKLSRRRAAPALNSGSATARPTSAARPTSTTSKTTVKQAANAASTKRVTQSLNRAATAGSSAKQPVDNNKGARPKIRNNSRSCRTASTSQSGAAAADTAAVDNCEQHSDNTRTSSKLLSAQPMADGCCCDSDVCHTDSTDSDACSKDDAASVAENCHVIAGAGADPSDEYTPPPAVREPLKFVAEFSTVFETVFSTPD